MSLVKPTRIQHDWLSKTLAGTLLGFTLALGCSGLFARLTPGLAMPVKVQLAMWMVAPIWLGVLGGVYAFGSGRGAWLWLGAVNLLVLGALAVPRLFSV